VDKACSCEDVFPSGERPVIFHLNAYKCFCPALAPPSVLRHFKSEYFSPSSATNPHHSSPSLISHLMPAITFNVFIPPVKVLHILLFPYFHNYSSFALLDLSRPARCFTTSATGSFAIAYSGPDQGLEIHTLPCFFHTQKPTVLHKLGAAPTTKSINLTCKMHASKIELLCTDQPPQN